MSKTAGSLMRAKKTPAGSSSRVGRDSQPTLTQAKPRVQICDTYHARISSRGRNNQESRFELESHQDMGPHVARDSRKSTHILGYREDAYRDNPTPSHPADDGLLWLPLAEGAAHPKYPVADPCYATDSVDTRGIDLSTDNGVTIYRNTSSTFNGASDTFPHYLQTNMQSDLMLLADGQEGYGDEQSDDFSPFASMGAQYGPASTVDFTGENNLEDYDTSNDVGLGWRAQSPYQASGEGLRVDRYSGCGSHASSRHRGLSPVVIATNNQTAKRLRADSRRRELAISELARFGRHLQDNVKQQLDEVNCFVPASSARV
jgi:hypothetical protein